MTGDYITRPCPALACSNDSRRAGRACPAPASIASATHSTLMSFSVTLAFPNGLSRHIRAVQFDVCGHHPSVVRGRKTHHARPASLGASRCSPTYPACAIGTRNRGVRQRGPGDPVDEPMVLVIASARLGVCLKFVHLDVREPDMRMRQCGTTSTRGRYRSGPTWARNGNLSGRGKDQVTAHDRHARSEYFSASTQTAAKGRGRATSGHAPSWPRMSTPVASRPDRQPVRSEPLA